MPSNELAHPVGGEAAADHDALGRVADADQVQHVELGVGATGSLVGTPTPGRPFASDELHRQPRARLALQRVDDLLDGELASAALIEPGRRASSTRSR